MGEWRTWMWLVMTDKGDFFITVSGRWMQGEAAKKVWELFGGLGLNVTGMVARKRATGPADITGTLVEQEEPEDKLGYYFLAGRRFWEVCGRAAEYEAEMILLNESMRETKEGG